ncbi:uncharacterized protein EV420DRAFT_1717414 [Desarmillaria tabescens]|uniref:Uncharacterized protein n=1 Tax=Armillaria tabescens TaxID=1929756 RepID=A0AA39JMT1_ARMTA|nr:uncharacterized protein EV420DRAFT_1717414 [Desarmillaria tabescens]KAK0445656.1 hypothetical protein EV420DRAFT_1717414 [Desarmillaria tabescens]
MTWPKSSFRPDPGGKYCSCRACKSYNMTRHQELFAPPPWEKHSCHSLKGLPISHMPRTRRKRQRHSDEEYSTLQVNLRPFDGPFAHGTFDEDNEFAVDMRNAICTSIPSCELVRFPELVSRKRVALRILKNSLNVKLGPSHAVGVTRDQYEKTFRYEFELLEKLLRQTWAVRISNGDLGVRIDSSIFSRLQAALRQRKRQASHSLVIHEIDLDCPSWGQDISLFMTENDFELYSLCFRASIEYFLAEMDNHHDWETGKPWPTLDEWRKHAGKLTHSMQTITDKSEQRNSSATGHHPRSKVSKSPFSLKPSPVLPSVKTREVGFLDGPCDISMKGETEGKHQPQSWQSAGGRNSDRESKDLPSSRQYTGLSLETEDNQFVASSKSAPTLSSAYLQRPASRTVGPCDLNAMAAKETKPEVAPHKSHLYTDLRRDDGHSGNVRDVNPTHLPMKPQPPKGLANRSLEISLTTSTPPPMLKVPSVIGSKPSKGGGNQRVLPEGIAAQTQQRETNATKDENHTTLKTSTLADQTANPNSIMSCTGSPRIMSVMVTTESKRPQSQQKHKSEGVFESEDKISHCRDNNTKQTAYKPVKSESPPQMHAKRSLHERDHHSVNPCCGNPTHLPTISQATTGPSDGSPKASVTSPMNDILLNYPSDVIFVQSKGKGNQRILPEAIPTQMQQSETKAMKENYALLKRLTPASRIVIPMKDKVVISQTGEEKAPSRKIRRALEREQKMTSQQQPAPSKVVKTKLVQSSPEGRVVEYPPPLKFERITSKTSPDIAAAPGRLGNIQLGTSLNHIPFSMIYIHIAICPTLSSGNSQASLLVHSSLALPEIDPSVAITEQQNDEASEFEAKGIIVDVEAFASGKWHNRERNRHVGAIRRLEDLIQDLGANMQRTVQIRITLNIDEGKNEGTSNQCQNLDTISRVNGLIAESTRRQYQGAHHQYHPYFGKGSQEPAHADSQLHRMKSWPSWAPSNRMSPERHPDVSGDRNHFEVTVKVDSGHLSADSLAVPDQVQNANFNLILDSSGSEKSVRNEIPEFDEPCPPYVQGVG